MAPACSTRAATPQSRRTASPSSLLPYPLAESGQDTDDDETADDKEEDGLCGGGGGGGIFSACRNTNGLDRGGCWLDGLFDACRNPNGANTANKGNHGAVSSSPDPPPAPDFIPAFAATRRSLAPAPTPVLGAAPSEKKGGGFWRSHGGDKGVQEEGDVAIEDLTANFDEEAKADPNEVRKRGRGSIQSCVCAYERFLRSRQPRYPTTQ